MSNTKPLPGSDSFDSRAYTRQADHTPNTTNPESDVYILALRTDVAHHQRMTALRNQYFPPKINKLEAHVALFRALPGSHLTGFSEDIKNYSQAHKPFPIRTTKAFALGHGVAIHVDAPEATDIYEGLRCMWTNVLSKQDQSFKAHYTIQNKVEKEVAEKTLQEVRETFHGSQGTVTGLVLYRYDKGFWRHTRDFDFVKKEEQLS